MHLQIISDTDEIRNMSEIREECCPPLCELQQNFHLNWNCGSSSCSYHFGTGSHFSGWQEGLRLPSQLASASIPALCIFLKKVTTSKMQFFRTAFGMISITHCYLSGKETSVQHQSVIWDERVRSLTQRIRRRVPKRNPRFKYLKRSTAES